MTFKQLTEHHLGCLSYKGGCTGSSDSTLVKIPHCWKWHVTALSFSHLRALDILQLLTWLYHVNKVFFSLSIFHKQFFQEHYQSVQLFGFRSEPTILSVLISVQTVCKDYQRATKSPCVRKDFLNGTKNRNPLRLARFLTNFNKTSFQW